MSTVKHFLQGSWWWTTFGVLAASTSYAASPDTASGTRDAYLPTSAFVQAGFGDQSTSAYVAGLRWDLPWHRDFSFGTVGAYTEIAAGRWHTDDRGHVSNAWPTQISLTPALRLHPSIAPNWFAEIGVGANYIVPLFRSGEKRFSTEFNFGDHAAIGRSFGRSELSLRIEHFSNAGISHPNPGENFVQLRYAYRL